MDQLLTNFIRALRNADVRISDRRRRSMRSAPFELVGYRDRQLLERQPRIGAAQDLGREGGIRYVLRSVLSFS